jgi:hypothetical protein
MAALDFYVSTSPITVALLLIGLGVFLIGLARFIDSLRP